MSDECTSGSCSDGVCDEPRFCTTPDEPDAIASPGVQATAIDPAAMEVARLLNGKFSSAAQSISNPSYFNIHLSSCLVRAPAYGNLVLYVEQAASATLNEPYRQRLYVLTVEGDTVQSEIWAPTLSTTWVGTCDSATVVDIPENAFTLREGCDVWLTQSQEGYTGGTEGKGCSSSLAGAAYATSEVTLYESQLLSWDRGFSANDGQVWGATAGPYKFLRLTEIVEPATWKTLIEDLL